MSTPASIEKKWQKKGEQLIRKTDIACDDMMVKRYAVTQCDPTEGLE